MESPGPACGTGLGPGLHVLGPASRAGRDFSHVLGPARAGLGPGRVLGRGPFCDKSHSVR
jgi:hypothetical protein